MKTPSASRSAFFNPYVLIGFVFCSIGLFLVLIELSKSVTGTSATTGTANPVPLINQPLIPDAIAPGGPGFTLTVNGTGFVTGSVVNWNGSARATTFVSTSQLTATIPASDIASAGTASVSVVNPSPGGGTSNVVFLPITSPTSSVSLNRSDYATGSTPNSAATADFNGDGNLDLSVTNYTGNTVSILIGNGDGSFQPRVDYATGSGPDSVAARDFNGDGILDLAVRNNGSSTISILLGNGDGTFQNHIDSPTGPAPQRLTAGDFNGDGKLDLAVTNGGNTVSILLGNGDGTFQTHVDYPTGEDPGGVTTGDFNLDGNLDIAVGNSISNTVSILLGRGDGTFESQVTYTVGLNPGSITTADLNGDNKLDLLVANANANTVSILVGNGDGSFQPRVDYSTGLGPYSIAAADLNGDGKLDLSVTNLLDNTVSILLGNGDGSFQPRVDYSTGLGPQFVCIGDFNKDGGLDLAAVDVGENTVSVLLQATTVALSDTNLKFDPQLVGSVSTAQMVTLTNSGPIMLTISSIAASGDFLQENNCGSSVPAGESCTIRVAFKPSAKGVRTGIVTITDDAVNNPQTIKLKGTGTVVQVSPSALDFGDQIVGTTSDPLTATVTNIGSEDLHIFGIGIGGANFGDFAETTTCGSRLAAGGSCTIDVTFTPGERGDRHASLKIVDDGGASPQAVPLAGTGVPR
jgi:hypothetical protein